MILRRFTGTNPDQTGYEFWCPGCDAPHSVRVSGPPPVWGFNGNESAPTFTPSIRCFDDRGTICHSNIREGKIQFQSDCRHSMAGKTVPLPQWPADIQQDE